MTAMPPNEPGDGLPAWSALQADWVAVAGPDPLRLWARVRAKRRRMIVVQVSEVLLALFATTQVVRLIVHPRDGVWLGWLWSMLALIWLSVLASAWLRRRLWRTPAMEPTDMLRLTAQRARLGFWMGVGNLIWAPGFLLVSAPMFEHMWALADMAARHRLYLGAMFNSLLMGVVALVSAWYVLRQRRRLRRIAALLDQLRE
jgi:hypothetical protein